MRKLIEVEQNALVVCDRPGCGFEIGFNKTEDNKFLVMYVDTVCPRCGDNLLTSTDYLQSRKIEKMVNWINKWFSWLTWFDSKKEVQNPQSFTVHVNDGVKIKCGNIEDFKSTDENSKTYTWKNLKKFKEQ